METDGCQYLFMWNTAAVCGLTWGSTSTSFLREDALTAEMNEEWALPSLLPYRTIDARSYDDDSDSTLSRRSRALGVVLTVLLVGLTVCLVGLLLHKRERRWGYQHKRRGGESFGNVWVILLHLSPPHRELVIQKVAGCCRRGNQISYKYSKVGWLSCSDCSACRMLGFDLLLWSISHSATLPVLRSTWMKKAVKRRWSGWWKNSKPLKPHPLSGVEVTMPTVTSQPSRWTRRVCVRSRWTSRTTTARTRCWASPGCEWSKPPEPPGTLWPNAAPSSRWASPFASAVRCLHPQISHQSRWFQEESDEDLVGLLEESDRKRKSRKPRSSGLNHGNNTTANRKRDEDDSDEDLLRVWCHSRSQSHTFQSELFSQWMSP